ncbi:hypothetical protein JQ628_04930 [Bradyrhizobium lablabi]|uniref:hypothetical protein n=1 Tax=Bradyrhizobium lablabi TaxID=722472 RepID=UPI001BAA6504|nr:hypothetical protein [Bradyrhizobium lablabi]MBR1120852.1 hypothetical protein [Bradyrhizobium lablabi]
MTQTFRFCRALLAGLGLIVALAGAARAEDYSPADSTRDSIIQGVRDDVRRKIRDQQAAENRAEAATVGQPSPRVYRPKKKKRQASR